MEAFFLVVCLLLMSSSHGAITFDGSKSSFAQFHKWQPSSSSSGVVGTLSFHFKTHLKNSLLVYQDDGQSDYISIELKNGKILTTSGTLSNSVRVDIGQDLDDMNWHILMVKIAGNSVTLTLDKSLTKTANNLPKNSALSVSSGYLYVGGLPRSRSLSSLSWMGAAFKKGFVGCVKKLMVTTKENNLERAVLIKSKGTKSGCLNECRAQNPCLNNGRCINRFSKAKCDCSGTGFEGTKCEKEILQLHLRSNDYVVYDMSSNPAATKSDSIRIKFKTSKKNGILLKTKFGHDYVIIKLSKGLAVVEWDLGSGQLKITVPSKKVHDNQWHELSIKRSKRTVTVSLDKGVDVEGTTPPNHSTFNMHGGEGKVYVGGDGGSRKQFQGCLKWVVFNGVEFISKLKAKDPRFSVRGNTMWNCPIASTTPQPNTPPPMRVITTGSRARNWEERKTAKPIAKPTAKPTNKPSTKHPKSTRKATKKATKPTAHFRKTTECSPNDVRCFLVTFPTKKPHKTSPNTKSTYKSSKGPTDRKILTDNGTTTAKTPKVEGIEGSKELGNVPTAIGLVAGSIVLFIICAVISVKLKKMRDRKSSHAHQITIETREVDEMIDTKVYQPDAYENKS